MNKAAFDQLYREHYHRVLGLCRRLLGNAADAEDAAQEVFMRAYLARSRFRRGSPFGPWINTIGSNVCIDALRKRARLNDLDRDADPDDIAADAPSVSEALISDHDNAAIAGAVEALPEKYRVPIVLAFYAEASYEDIASRLDITRNHVGVLLSRGKQALRRALAAQLNPNSGELAADANGNPLS